MPAEVVADTPIDYRDPSIVALPNGELLVVFMTYDNKRTAGTHQVLSVRSTDAGRTWSQPEPVDTPFTQLEAISTPPRLMPDGRLLLTPYGNHTGDTRSYKHAAVLESRDLGKTWQGPVALDNVLGAYPSMVELPDGRVLVVYYTEGKGSDIRCLYLRADSSGVRILPRE